jgi:WD40 repeat protein
MAVPGAMGSLLVFNTNDYGLAVRGSTDLYTGIYDQQELNLYCVEQYSLESGARIRVILAPTTREVNSVAMSPDGNFVAYSNYSGPTRVMRVADGREQLSVAGGSRVWISPDGSKMLVSESGNGVMRSFPDGTELWRTTILWTAAFSPNGGLLAALRVDGW